ncbi:hypothetical protein HYV87_02360, partial [Candidatus Woesearchaeota archaeon]|nr:hypothetical protein [Candidatus Woesearchaeota archaeon]
VAVNELMGSVGFQEMLLFIGVALVAGGAAALLTIYFSKLFAKYIVKVNYTKLLLGIIIFITLLVLYFDGFIGLTILLTATAIGTCRLYCISFCDFFRDFPLSRCKPLLKIKLFLGVIEDEILDFCFSVNRLHFS